MKYFYIELNMILGEIEKSSTCIRQAESRDEAVKDTLEGECHYGADFTEFPDGEACWDGDQFVYRVRFVKELSKLQYDIMTNIQSTYAPRLIIEELNHLWTDMEMIMDDSLDFFDHDCAEASQDNVERIAEALNATATDTRGDDNEE